jgi:hypothetical protein
MKALPERLSARAAWGLWAFSLVLVAISVASWPLNHLDLQDIAADGAQLQVTLIALTFPTVGVLIAYRLPRNPVGWLFYGAGVIEGTNAVVGAYSVSRAATAATCPSATGRHGSTASSGSPGWPW